jgi:hypothetical protein
MSIVSFKVTISNGSGDVSISIFDHLISFEHFFPTSGTWNQDLHAGHYLINIAGTCPPGGSVAINITGIQSCGKQLPIIISKGGPFIIGTDINV